MKRVLAIAAMLVVTGSAMARGPDYRGLPNGKGGPISVAESHSLAEAPAYNLTGAQEKAPAATQPADAKKYVCPMGCAGSESDKPGKCPKCGMKLEEKKATGPRAHPPALRTPNAGRHRATRTRCRLACWSPHG